MEKDKILGNAQLEMEGRNQESKRKRKESEKQEAKQDCAEELT